MICSSSGLCLNGILSEKSFYIHQFYCGNNNKNIIGLYNRHFFVLITCPIAAGLREVVTLLHVLSHSRAQAEGLALTWDFSVFMAEGRNKTLS